MSQEIVTNVMSKGADLSIIGLISGADIVVKIVLLLLLMASVWSWAIIIDKYLLLNKIKQQIAIFEKVFWSGKLLDQLYEKLKSKTSHPLVAVFVAAMDERARQKNNKRQKTLSYLNIGFKDRIAQVMEVAKNQGMEELEGNLSFLAVVGSSSPFVGLFGTVWGIMNSFQAIASMKNATIAVVAPGIAEALFATAVGLVAAIPAVIFYNILSTKINNINNKVESFSSELHSLLSQEIDKGIDHDHDS